MPGCSSSLAYVSHSVGGTMRIEIICTGDEVLTGKIVNTNFSYMSQKLEDVGLAVQWETTVGDNREELLRAFQLAGLPLRRYDRWPGADRG